MLCTILTTGAAIGVSLTQTKQYTADTALLFRDPGFDQKLFGSMFAEPSQDPDRAAATNVRLISLRSVAERTARQLGDGVTAGEVAKAVSVRAEGQSDLVTVEMTTPDPKRSAEWADVFAAEYVTFRRDADRSKIQQAQDLIEQRLATLAGTDDANRKSLSNRLDQLRVLAALQTGNAEVAEPAVVPRSPSSPAIRRNAVLGAFLGLLLGVVIAFLLERIDRRLNTTEDIEEVFQTPVVGIVPESASIPEAIALRGRDMPAAETEAFRMLSASLRFFNVDREIKTLLVTSSAPGDGKSTVAWSLAEAAAGGGRRVLVVEADLRRPSLGRSEYVDEERSGLSQLLSGSAKRAQVTQSITLQPSFVGPGSLDLISAGGTPPNPIELLDSQAMRELLDDVRGDYDLVVIDTPPVSVVSDAFPLIRSADGILVVARMGRSTRDSLAHLRVQLQNLGGYVLGVVANAYERNSFGRGRGYGYGYGGYGYGTYGEPERPAPAEDDELRERDDEASEGESLSNGASQGESKSPRASRR